MEPELLRQIPILEDALRAMGVTVWATVREEADDALASGVAVAVADRRVAQVRLLTPDKDLGQCVRGRRVIQVDRRSGAEIDEDGVRAKFGVRPASIPDYLALVGDPSDGFPGLPGWGAKSASALLAHYVHLERIPEVDERWIADGIQVRGAAKLAATFRERRAEADLFKRLATLVETVEVGAVDDWRWRGPTPSFAAVARDLGAESLADRAARLAEEPPPPPDVPPAG
jgi:5'-3' exonuclease